MRYIQFVGEIPNLDSLRERGKTLSAQVKKQHRRAKLLHIVGNFVFGVVFLGAFIGLCLLISWITPEAQSVWEIVLSVLLTVIMGLVALIAAAIIGAVVASPLWGFWQRSEKEMLRRAQNEACADIRQFYQFNEPFLVTKCYRSSDKRFDRHDVCLFAVDGELRITGNLHYGFFDPKRDLGCYCVTPQEIRLSDGVYKDRPAVELQADGISFLLGQRAGAYVKTFFKNVLSE